MVQRQLSAGSKSERAAAILVTSEGDYELRRPEGNPFHDPTWDEWVGRTIQCEGVVRDGILFCDSWQEGSSN